MRGAVAPVDLDELGDREALLVGVQLLGVPEAALCVGLESVQGFEAFLPLDDPRSSGGWRIDATWARSA